MSDSFRLVRFTPTRTDDLRPEALEWVGREFEVSRAWEITEEDGGPYVGQTAWIPTDFDVRVGWIPDCDLSEVDAVSTLPYPVCVCRKCGPPWRKGDDWKDASLGFGSWMALCPTCGSKRCPGAIDHRDHPASDPADSEVMP